MSIYHSSEDDSFDTDSAFEEDFKLDDDSNDDYYEEDVIDYLTPTEMPEDAVKSCDQTINIEKISLETLTKDQPYEMESFQFDRYKITPQFYIDADTEESVCCRLLCEEHVQLDISLYIPSLEVVSFNRYCSFNKDNNIHNLEQPLFPSAKIPKEPITDAYFSIHLTPSEKLCRQYFNCVGLVNSGMTCYLNSLIQCLYHIKPFRSVVYNCQDTGSLAKKSKIANAMRDLFSRMQTSYVPVSTRDLTTAFGWNSYDYLFQQHDVQELTRILLSRLDDVTNNKGSQFFKGKNEITILTSQSSSSHIEEFGDLSLTVNNLSTLEESLEKYYEPDKLTGDNQYELGDGTKCDAEVQVKVIESPSILNFHLRRFEYDNASGEMSKIYSRFAFKECLIFNGEEYELLSIIAHNGSVLGGHYNAFVKIDGEWTNFDDECVRHCEHFEALDQNFGDGKRSEFTAYVLFYVKKGFNEIEDPQVPKDVIEKEEDRLSKTKITVFFDNINNYKELNVKKNLDTKEFIDLLSKETQIPVDKIVVRKFSDNYETEIIEEPIPTSNNFIYVDFSPATPVWVNFWIPDHEIISLGVFHVTLNIDTARMLGKEILRRLNMIPSNIKTLHESKGEEKDDKIGIDLECFVDLDNDFTPIEMDTPIDQSCNLLFQFAPKSLTKEIVESFKENLIKQKNEKVFKDFTKLNEMKHPKYETHLDFLPEIKINNVVDFMKYTESDFHMEFCPFDDPESKDRKFVLYLSKHLTFDELLLCLSRKIASMENKEPIDINNLLLFFPDKYFKGPDHKPLSRDVFTTIESFPNNYDTLYIEVLNDNIRDFNRADVTVMDSRGNKISRFPILFPRGQMSTIKDLREKISEKIQHDNFYLYYVKGSKPILIPSLIKEQQESQNNEEQNEAQNNEEQNKGENEEGQKEDKTNEGEKEEETIDYLDSEIQFDYKIFAQVYETSDIVKIKQFEDFDSEKTKFDYRVLDEKDVVKLRVVRFDQLFTFIMSPHLPFVLFVKNGTRWKDIIEMFPDDKIKMVKQKSRRLDPIDVDETKMMENDEIFAIIYNKKFDSFLFGADSNLQINHEKFNEDENEEEEAEYEPEEEEIPEEEE